MKKIFTLAFIILCILSKAQQLSYTHDFEAQNQLTISIGTNTDNIWQIGKPNKALFSGANSQPNALITDTVNKYSINNVSSFTMAIPLITVTCGWCPFALQWTQKLDMEQGKDGGTVEFSMNNQTWYSAFSTSSSYQFYGYMPANVSTITTNETAFTGTDNTWRSLWLCVHVPMTTSNDTIWVRFTFKSDAVQTNQEGWVIDNFYAHSTMAHPIKENSLDADLTVYPNTTNGMVNIEAKKHRPDLKIDNILLVDINGKIIEDYGSTFSKVVIDMSKHPTGTYYFTIRIGKKVESYKVIYVKE